FSLPDMAEWGRVVGHFVKPGGVFYIAEGHPILMVLDELDEPYLRLEYPYWTPAEPLKFENEGSYADRSQPVTVPFQFGWTHSLGENVTAIAQAGLRIEFLHEFDFVNWPVPPLTEE